MRDRASGAADDGLDADGAAAGGDADAPEKESDALRYAKAAVRTRSGDVATAAVAANNLIAVRAGRELFDSLKWLKLAVAECDAAAAAEAAGETTAAAKLPGEQRHAIRLNWALLLLHMGKIGECREAIATLKSELAAAAADEPEAVEAAAPAGRASHARAALARAALCLRVGDTAGCRKVLEALSGPDDETQARATTATTASWRSTRKRSSTRRSPRTARASAAAARAAHAARAAARRAAATRRSTRRSRARVATAERGRAFPVAVAMPPRARLVLSVH